MRGILPRIFVDSPITKCQRHSKIIPIFPALRNCILNIIKRRHWCRDIMKLCFFELEKQKRNERKNERVKFNNFSR